MPYIPDKPHSRRRIRVILWKLQLRLKHPSLEWRALWTHDKCLPIEQVFFSFAFVLDGTGDDSIGWVLVERAVLLGEAADGCVWCHVGGSVVE